MADLVAARDRIAEIAANWSVEHHGVVAVYSAPPNSYQRILSPSVVIANVTLPVTSFTGGQISSTYGLAVDWLFGTHEKSGFDAALEALPMMIEMLATDRELTTTCTGNLTVVGGDPAVGIFEFDGKQFYAARVVVLCGFVDAAELM